MQKMNQKISKFEINRKILHILFAIVPIALYYIPQNLCLPITIIFAIACILFDVVLKKLTLSNKFGNIFYRQGELLGSKKFSGSFWIAVSSLICVGLFNKQQYIPAMLAISFCDTFASLIGQKYGKHKLFGTKKTLEGSIGFMLGVLPIYLIISLLGIQISFTVLFIVIFCGAMAEVIITKLDDNLSIMLCICLVLKIFQAF